MANTDVYNLHEQKLLGVLNNFKSIKKSWDKKIKLEKKI